MFLFFTFLFSLSLYSATDIETLAHSQKWLRLLHYKKSWTGKFEGQADGKKFFLSPDGKTEPKAELKAAIAAFASKTNPTDSDAACMFPARLKWLSQEMGHPWKIDLSGCQNYIAFFSKVAAKRASIVFSSYYLGNPNTAFGHTLLRLSRYESKEETEMLDYGINYAAHTKGANPFTYAFKGLFGGFKGYFASLPYYYKIREYSDSEFRDLWSYDLKLTQGQILEMVDHIWELGHTDFDYYYFLENCSYHLLALIEVVAPDKHLTDEYSVFAIPADTIRLLQQENLIEEGKRRESTYSRLNRLSEHLTMDSLKIARAIEENPKETSVFVKNLEPKKAADILDVAIEAFDYFYADKILTDDKKAMEEKHFILKERAINPIISEDAKVTTNQADSPAKGHAPTRYALAEGYRSDQGKETRLQWRAALHDLLDPEAGTLKQAQLEIGKVTLNYKEKNYTDPRLVFQDLTILSIKNYPSQSFWASPMSWEIEAGMQQIDRVDCFDCPESVLMGSVGNTFSPGNEALFISFLLNGEFNLQTYYERGYRIGVGPKVLSRLIIHPKWVAAIEAHYHFGNVQELEGQLETRYHVNHDFSFMLQFKGTEINREWQRSGLLGLQYFH